MNVLSLFNGMSTGHTALDNVGIKVDKYYSSEIKPAAIKLTIDWASIDMVLSGSPCQDLSIAGKRKGLEGERSSLFWVFVEIFRTIQKLNPYVLFLQENVGSAPKSDIGIMSRALGVYPVRINSKLVTAQMRDRYYWSNIRTTADGLFGDIKTDIPQPKDKKIMFKDILTNGAAKVDKHTCLVERTMASASYKDMESDKAQKFLKERESRSMMSLVYVDKDKAGTLVSDNMLVRTVNKIELCRLQGFPDDWCDILTKNQAGSLLGDGWTLPIIEHIFSFIKK